MYIYDSIGDGLWRIWSTLTRELTTQHMHRMRMEWKKNVIVVSCRMQGATTKKKKKKSTHRESALTQSTNNSTLYYNKWAKHNSSEIHNNSKHQKCQKWWIMVFASEAASTKWTNNKRFLFPPRRIISDMYFCRFYIVFGAFCDFASIRSSSVLRFFSLFCAECCTGSSARQFHGDTFWGNDTGASVCYRESQTATHEHKHKTNAIHIYLSFFALLLSEGNNIFMETLLVTSIYQKLIPLYTHIWVVCIVH